MALCPIVTGRLPGACSGWPGGSGPRLPGRVPWPQGGRGEADLEAAGGWGQAGRASPRLSYLPPGGVSRPIITSVLGWISICHGKHRAYGNGPLNHGQLGLNVCLMNLL